MATDDLTLAFDASSLAAMARLAVGGALIDAAIAEQMSTLPDEVLSIIQSHMNFDRGYSTGALEDSLVVERPSPLSFEIGTDIPYAKFVDYGTGQRGAADPGDTHGDPTYHYGPKPGMTGEPYMGPAMEEAQPIIERDITDAIEHALDIMAGVP